jgi:uncharacterized protein
MRNAGMKNYRGTSPIITALTSLYIFGSLALVLPLQAASFDCVKAASKIEKIICGNDELSRLDEDLNKIYKQALERSDDKQKETKEQRRWLKEARNTCQDIGCLKTAYQERINRLGTIAGQKLADGSDNGNAARKQAALPPKRPPSQKTSLCTPESLCDKVTLMYSEDDSICKPLLKVYQQLFEKNKKDREYNSRSQSHPSTKVYWEDYYQEVFIKSGFVSPPPLRDDQHEYVSSKDGELGTAYYRLRLDPNVAEQTVLIQDYPYGSRGAYSSDVYISKPGEDISTKCSLDQFALIHGFIDQSGGIYDFRQDSCGNQGRTYNELAFATAFNMANGSDHIPHAETLIEEKYVFNKGNTGKEFSYIINGDVRSTDMGIYSNAEIIQRIYMLQNKPIFTARDGHNQSVVYQIKNGSQMNDICYFSTNVAKISH